MKMTLPEEVRFVLGRLQSSGYEAYLVGGCVRDILLGETPHDFDVTTNALPGNIPDIFPDCRVLKTGMQHGTVTVIRQTRPIEITTYRIDGTYQDHRHPEKVSFTGNLRDDLARRDFTVNAMAYHPERGIIDYFHGQEDLRHRIIRCVGLPHSRFQEDALRILRAARFASCLDFEVEPETRSAMLCTQELLSYVASERITTEIQRLLCGAAVERIVAEYPGLLAGCILLPHAGTNSPVFRKRLAEQPALRFSCLPKEFPIRLAFYLSQFGADDTHCALCLSKKQRQEVSLLLSGQNRTLPETKQDWYGWIASAGPLIVRKTLMLQLAKQLSSGGSGQTQENGLQKLDDLLAVPGSCYTRKDLAISGDDLLRLGLCSGKRLGQLFDLLLQEIWAGRLENTRSALLARVQQLL